MKPIEPTMEEVDAIAAMSAAMSKWRNVYGRQPRALKCVRAASVGGSTFVLFANGTWREIGGCRKPNEFTMLFKQLVVKPAHYHRHILTRFCSVVAALNLILPHQMKTYIKFVGRVTCAEEIDREISDIRRRLHNMGYDLVAKTE